MKPTAFPEANRLTYRIRTAITGESTGQETAKLAWQQAEAVERANHDLSRALKALEDGSLLECLFIEASHPSLLDTAKSLDHPLAEAWKTRCETYSWRISEPVDIESVSKIQAAIDEQGDLKEWLFKQYRTAARSKKQKKKAYQIINLIAARFPADENAIEEVESQKKQLIEQAAAEVRENKAQLIPEQQPKDIVVEYTSIGLPLNQSADPDIAEAVEECLEENTHELTKKAEELISDAQKLEDGQDWQTIENAYLELDYSFAIYEARGRIAPEIRNEVDAVATRLAHLRLHQEYEILIRTAIDEVKNGANSNAKPVKLANRIEKLKSLESQAPKTGVKISPELQNEITLAYSVGARHRLPLYGGLAALAVLLIVGAFVLTSYLNTRKAEAAVQDRALAALQAVEKTGQVSDTRKALAEWSDEIEKAELDSKVAHQADTLSDWIELQMSLESAYISSINELATIAATDAPLQAEAVFQAKAEEIRDQRSDLAPDLGKVADNRFNEIVDQFARNKAELLAKERQEIQQVEGELRIAAQNATQARSRVEFERLQAAAEARVQRLNQMLQSESAADQSRALAPVLESATQQLSAVETKWDALDNAWIQLSKSTSLTPYLDQIERIHSFDILPAEIKTALGQTLRLKDNLLELQKEGSAIVDPAAKKAFSSNTDYLATQPELSEDERAYLSRLLNLERFKNIYQSTVQYFEGESDPQSEYQVYLVEPVAKSSSEEDGAQVTFTFNVRGFDEFGNPEATPRDIQFISRSDGSFWGFFYKPATLSAESVYYNGTLTNNLTHLLAGADRMAVIKQLRELEKQDQLSPAFRVYWHQQLTGFMELNPWNWGLALSPALKRQASLLKTLPSGDGNETLWLSTIEQTVPSPEFKGFLDNKLEGLPEKEVAAMAGLYRKVAKGEYLLAGQVAADGKLILIEDTDGQAPLWSVNSLTGTIETITAGEQLTPFAPILSYSIVGGESAAEILRKASLASGFKLDEQPYKALLPALYQ